MGSAVHNAITLFYHLPPAQQNKESLIKGLEQTWRNFDIAPEIDTLPLGKVGGFKTKEQERAAYRETQKMLKNFYNMRQADWNIHYLPTPSFARSIEDYKNLIVPLNKDYDISGKFDLVVKEESGLHIIDFKTGKSEENSNFQLRFYKLLAAKNFNQPVTKASFYYLKFERKREVDMTKHSQKSIEKEILEKIENIVTTREFEPHPTNRCDFCLFRKTCSRNIDSQPETSAPEDLPF